MSPFLALLLLAAPPQGAHAPSAADSPKCLVLMTEMAKIAATPATPVDAGPERAAITAAADVAANAARAAGGFAGGLAAEVINAERANAIAAIEEARMAEADAVHARVEEVERRYVAAGCDAG